MNQSHIQQANIKVGIVGGTGYTGVELIRLLSRHPNVRLCCLTSRTEKGKKVAELFGNLYGVHGVNELVFDDLDTEKLANCDVVFFATPHGVAMQHAKTLTERGVKVIDLAADFRLQDLDAFVQWYGMEHCCADLLKQAVYGLPEINRESIKTAQIIGNPGCYPTTAILGLKPIIDCQNRQNEQLIDERIVIDAKSGVSGAGRQGKLDLIFCETADNFYAYGVAGHRHLPEIQQGVQHILASKFTQKIRFVPHLVPMIRGMFTTIHLQLTKQGQTLDWYKIYQDSYQNERFVQVLDRIPQTRFVRASNTLCISIHQHGDELTVMVVQDNLVKGAAGQAVQNMNILFGLDEGLGLDVVAVLP